MKLEGSVVGIPGAMVRDVDHLPDVLPDAVSVGFHAQAKPGQLLQVVPGVARYLARDGMVIEAVVEPGAAEDQVDLYLNGAVRGALIHQRGELPLHAATLLPPGRETGAVALCGPSGAGKSTLCAELSRRGWRLVADDLTRVTLEGGEAIAWPGRPAIKLWANACAMLGQDTTSLRPVRAGLDKFFVPAAAAPGPVALRTIVELQPTPPGPMIAVTGVDRWALLSENTYRPRQIKPLGVAAHHMRIVSAVASATEVYRLPGARHISLSDLADQVTDTVG